MNFFHFFFSLMCEIASFEPVGPVIYLTQVSQGVGERGKSPHPPKGLTVRLTTIV